MISRHPFINSDLLTREVGLTWLRDISGLAFVRETVAFSPIAHNRVLLHSEIVGNTCDAAGEPVRLFYLSHREPGDGQGEFVPDECHGIPADPQSLKVNTGSRPPVFGQSVSPDVVAREAALHKVEQVYWRRFEDSQRPEPPPKPLTFLQRLMK